jgi:hypothetical protein
VTQGESLALCVNSLFQSYICLTFNSIFRYVFAGAPGAKKIEKEYQTAYAKASVMKLTATIDQAKLLEVGFKSIKNRWKTI